MPRKPLIRTSILPYHLSSRSNNREWFYIPAPELWEILLDILGQSAKKFDLKIHAMVLMSNHYHMLARTPQENIDQVMKFFNQNLGRRIARSAGRINRIFGSPYRWSIINTNHYYFNVYRYIYQNPVRAHLSDKVESYPYSTLFNQNYVKYLSIDDIPLDNYRDLQMLNDIATSRYDESIRKGLRRANFAPSKVRGSWKKTIPF